MRLVLLLACLSSGCLVGTEITGGWSALCEPGDTAKVQIDEPIGGRANSETYECREYSFSLYTDAESLTFELAHDNSVASRQAIEITGVTGDRNVGFASL